MHCLDMEALALPRGLIHWSLARKFFHVWPSLLEDFLENFLVGN